MATTARRRWTNVHTDASIGTDTAACGHEFGALHLVVCFNWTLAYGRRDLVVGFEAIGLDAVDGSVRVVFTVGHGLSRS